MLEWDWWAHTNWPSSRARVWLIASSAHYWWPSGRPKRGDDTSLSTAEERRDSTDFFVLLLLSDEKHLIETRLIVGFGGCSIFFFALPLAAITRLPLCCCLSVPKQIYVLFSAIMLKFFGGDCRMHFWVLCVLSFVLSLASSAHNLFARRARFCFFNILPISVCPHIYCSSSWARRKKVQRPAPRPAHQSENCRWFSALFFFFASIFRASAVSQKKKQH